MAERIKLTQESLVGPWAGLPVAWTADDAFDEAVYRADVARLCAAGVPGVFTGGTAGEFYAMDLDEFRAVVRATIQECMAPGKPVMVGCSDTYSRGVTRRVEAAVKLGASAIMVSFPYWLELGDGQIIPFFQEVAAAAAGLPIVYEETTRARRVLTVRQHQELKEAVPAYMAVHATADTVGTTPAGCQTLARFVNVLVNEEQWSLLGSKGAAGSCSTLVCWNPRLVMELWRCLRNGDSVTLGMARGRLRTLSKFLEVEFVAKGFTEPALVRLGGRATGFLQTSLRNRAPYRSATEADVETLRQWCARGYPELLAL